VTCGCASEGRRESEWGIGQLEKAGVGVGTTSTCVVGAESTATRERFGKDGSDMRGSRTSESGRVNGRSALTGGARRTDREHKRAGKGNRRRQGGPTQQRERGGGNSMRHAGLMGRKGQGERGSRLLSFFLLL
jgi:hypothetical protein